MNRNRALLILVFLGIFTALAYWLNLPRSQQTTPLASVETPTEVPPPPMESNTPNPTPLVEQTETVEPEVTKIERSKTNQPISKKSKHSEKPLMEVVDEDSKLGEEMADEETMASEKPPEVALPTLSPTETVEQLLKDANLITSGFEEADTDEIAGVWSGTIDMSKDSSPIFLNRIWDHMTDDYLPTSCFGFKSSGKIISGYLRHNTLHFYEKPGAKRTKLIIKLQNKYIFELLSPNVGSNRTTGQAYELRKNKLVPIGNLKIQKDVEATADMDCSYID